jgi:hypothetical protein
MITNLLNNFRSTVLTYVSWGDKYTENYDETPSHLFIVASRC